jgi:F0F1-type ATP synthase membrane subunit b/b'
MKLLAGKWRLRSIGALVTACLLVSAWPALAQEAGAEGVGSSTDVTFRWLNFVLVFGTLGYLIAKFGAPYFRGRAQGIATSIAEAGKNRAAAEREFEEAAQKLASIDADIEEERRSGTRDSAADRERIRALTVTEVEKIQQAARAEIAVAERAAAQELRAIAARLATERAALLIRQQLNEAAESALFDAFVGELEKAAS